MAISSRQKSVVPVFQDIDVGAMCTSSMLCSYFTYTSVSLATLPSIWFSWLGLDLRRPWCLGSFGRSSTYPKAYWLDIEGSSLARRTQVSGQWTKEQELGSTHQGGTQNIFHEALSCSHPGAFPKVSWANKVRQFRANSQEEKQQVQWWGEKTHAHEDTEENSQSVCGKKGL